jgi:hypothetical protein
MPKRAIGCSPAAFGYRAEHSYGSWRQVKIFTTGTAIGNVFLAGFPNGVAAAGWVRSVFVLGGRDDEEKGSGVEIDAGVESSVSCRLKMVLEVFRLCNPDKEVR